MDEGYSLLELLLAGGLIVALSAAAVPQTLVGLDDVRATSAARHLAGRIQWARQQAAARNAAVGLRFETDDTGGFRWTAYVDGNSDGIRTADIERGIDRRLESPERLSDTVPGATLALAADVPPVGATRPDGNPDPIRLGRSSILSLSPTGTATSGTVYVRAGHVQLAVRVLGGTGRSRVLAFDRATRAWRTR
jgi:type II secretory pathway pseudopilin PulG